MTVRQVRRSAMVPYDAAAMYRLVADVSRYPEFLPWCTGSRVLRSTASELEASIGVGTGPLQLQFTTCNTLNPPASMGLRLVEGPFRSLDGEWRFMPLGESGCEVELQLAFEFASAVQDKLFGALFARLCNELMDAFVQRAHAVYGESRR